MGRVFLIKYTIKLYLFVFRLTLLIIMYVFHLSLLTHGFLMKSVFEYLIIFECYK